MTEHLARLGYASKSAIYAIVGALAALTAFNRGGQITDTSGALRVVLNQPFGRVLLMLLAIGLCGYAVWRLLDAVADPDRDGTGPGGITTRIGNGIRGLIYGALGIEAIRLLRGMRGSRGDEAESWTARLLDLPFGNAIVIVAGAIAVGYAISEIIKGVRGTHDRKLDWGCVPADARLAVQRICRFGVATRGGLLATLGMFLVRAGASADPNQAAGSRESLLRLAGVFEGRWFLAVIAVGVIAYAIDQGVHAGCRRIRPVV